MQVSLVLGSLNNLQDEADRLTKRVLRGSTVEDEVKQLEQQIAQTSKDIENVETAAQDALKQRLQVLSERVARVSDMLTPESSPRKTLRKEALKWE